MHDNPNERRDENLQDLQESLNEVVREEPASQPIEGQMTFGEEQAPQEEPVQPSQAATTAPQESAEDGQSRPSMPADEEMAKPVERSQYYQSEWSRGPEPGYNPYRPHQQNQAPYHQQTYNQGTGYGQNTGYNQSPDYSNNSPYSNNTGYGSGYGTGVGAPGQTGSQQSGYSAGSETGPQYQPGSQQQGGYSPETGPGTPNQVGGQQQGSYQQSGYQQSWNPQNPCQSRQQNSYGYGNNSTYQYQNPYASGTQSTTPNRWGRRDKPEPQEPYSYDCKGKETNGASAEQPAYQWNLNDYEAAASSATRAKKGKGTKAFAIIMAAVVIVGVAVVAGYGIYNSVNGSAQPQGASSTPSADIPSLTVRDRPESEDYISSDGKLTTVQVARKVSPSVVGIANYQNSNSFTPAMEGSGIIMTADGYIVTNAHVVEDAIGLTVVLNNGETYAAQIIGVDSKTDLAVIKIEANNLTYAEFGNSDQVEVGEDVVAIGNPSGMVLAGSVTKGIVSAVNRNIGSNAYESAFIQIDAAINPGNSGGALVNEYGQVIGINSQKLIEIGYEGIGFAIPINDAIPIIEELIANGRVTGRAALGFTGQLIDETLARFNNYPVGVGVVSVSPNSDLASKGIAPGDIITKIDGQEITEFRVITDICAQKNPGDTVNLTVFRRNTNASGGRTFEVTVRLIEEE